MPNKLIWKERCVLCDVKHTYQQSKQCKTHKTIFNAVMRELLQQKRAKPKVCKDCHALGHNNKTSTVCEIYIKMNENIKEKIKKYMLTKDCLTGKTNDDHFAELSTMLGISLNRCKTLYDDISPIEFCDRPMDIGFYLQCQTETATTCHQ